MLIRWSTCSTKLGNRTSNCSNVSVGVYRARPVLLQNVPQRVEDTMKFNWMGNGVYTYHGDAGRFAEALAKFRDENQNLTVTAMAPIIMNIPPRMLGYVVNTEEKK